MRKIINQNIRWLKLRVIKDKRITEDEWCRIEQPDASTLSEQGDIIVPFNFWLENREALLQHQGQLGICINGDDNTEQVAEDLQHFTLIALEFPMFKDGRCYTHARLLRDRYNYTGELRAVGDVLRDQLFFMHRCGIDSFQVNEDKDMEDAIHGLSDFSIKYQTAADGAVPVYKNR